MYSREKWKKEHNGFQETNTGNDHITYYNQSMIPFRGARGYGSHVVVNAGMQFSNG